MSPAFSIYLDLLRFLAAFGVLLDHLSSSPITEGAIWPPLGRFGAAAVTIFFVLSGYVIAFVTATRERTPQEYCASRLARLYSVIVVALILTLVCDSIGKNHNPGFYAHQKILWKPESWQGYISSFLLINEWQVFGFNGISPGTNGPWWSLSFEGTYYLIAGLALFSRPLVWIPASLLILALSGKAIAALLPLWILGFFLYHTKHLTVRAGWPTTILLAITSAMILALPAIERYLPSTGSLISLPWGRGPFNRNLVPDYFVAVVFAMHLIAARSALESGSEFIGRHKAKIRWLGSLTFPLYLFHFPIISLLSSVIWWVSPSSVTRAIFIGGVTLLIVAILTPVCDRLKGVMRNAIHMRLPRATPVRDAS